MLTLLFSGPFDPDAQSGMAVITLEPSGEQRETFTLDTEFIGGTPAYYLVHRESGLSVVNLIPSGRQRVFDIIPADDEEVLLLL
jgi:hypothetical protein